MSANSLPTMFEMTDRAEMERSIAVMSLGLCAALRAGSVTVAEAGTRLFNPKVLAGLEALGLPDQLIEIVHLGTELEDVQRLVPERFGESMAEIEALALALLRGEASRELVA